MTTFHFTYHCGRCGFSNVSSDPDLEACSVPVDGDGAPVILMPNDSRTYADFPRCGGELDGPYVHWFDLPDAVRRTLARDESGRPA